MTTCIGCSDGSREGLTNISLYPEIAVCEGSWIGSISSIDADVLCDTGWHVCDMNDSTLRNITFSEATSFSGCFAINASHDSGTCQQCTNSNGNANDMGGLGSSCEYQSTTQSSCLASGRVDVVTDQTNSCSYQSGYTDGVVCCRD